MKPFVMVAAPGSVARQVSSALADRFALVATSERRKAAALGILASVQAIVTWEGFCPHLRVRRGVPVLRLTPEDDIAGLADRVAKLIPSRLRAERARRVDLAALASLPYDEFLELARFWATRDYLLGLMRTHGGNVSEAARAARIERESLHRLLRKHDLDAEAFRPHESTVGAA